MRSPIIIKVAIETVEVNSTAHVDLWYSSPFDMTMLQLEGLREVMPGFNTSVKFHQRIRSKSCIYCPEAVKKEDCLSNGLFCPIAPVSSNEETK